MIQHFKNISGAIIFASCLIACDDLDIKRKDYPRLQLNEATSSVTGVALTAEILDLGTSPIISFGFVWDTNTNLEVDSSYSAFLETDAKTGLYNLNISTDITNGQKYYVAPFIISEDYTVIGNILSFKGIGINETPRIDDFFPKQAAVGDTITVLGGNFSAKRSRSIVTLGDSRAKTIISDFDSLMFIVPQITDSLSRDELKLTVGGKTAIASSPFKLKP
ncbi:MAG: IPT/TIG domain-containing protein [Cyclobacteriaceae bacterium]